MDDTLQKNLYKDMHLAAVLSEAVSHKLNNSLSGIMGYLQFTLEKMEKHPPQDPELAKSIKYLQIAYKESLMSRSLMKSLRWFSKQYLYAEQSTEAFHIPLFERLEVFWGMLTEIEMFQKVQIIWEAIDSGKTAVDVSEESLFCLFYILILSILKICEEKERLELTISHGKDDDVFAEAIFQFSMKEAAAEEDIEDDFSLVSAIAKSLYSKIEFHITGADVRISLGLPLKVEKI